MDGKKEVVRVHDALRWRRRFVIDMRENIESGQKEASGRVQSEHWQTELDHVEREREGQGKQERSH